MMNVQRIEMVLKLGEGEKVVNVEGDPITSKLEELCVLLDTILHPREDEIDVDVGPILNLRDDEE